MSLNEISSQSCRVKGIFFGTNKQFRGQFERKKTSMWDRGTL
jgi:hypothetical protein